MTAGPSGYHQLADVLRDEIQSGRRAPGSRMPSELDLVQTFGVGRTTVRRAIRVLREEGLIDVRHGQVTRVRVEPERDTQVRVQRGSTMVFRRATVRERAVHDIGVGGYVAEIRLGARVSVYPADRCIFTFT